MKFIPFFYRFTKSQRRGIMALFIIIAFCQAGYFFVMASDFRTGTEKLEEEKQWLALQTEIDALKAKKAIRKDTIYPFNPNFISDYKGYTLGMSVAEIDRLRAFRKTGKYVNSAEDFKTVTRVSDSLLAVLSPYFKFPDWVNKPKSYSEKSSVSEIQSNSRPYQNKEAKIAVIDINEALEEDLDKVYGIGPAFAKKILRRRAQLGAYVSMEQMKDFPEFSPEAITGLNKYFAVTDKADVTKIDINSASLNQLSYFPYFNRNIAKAIITKRSMRGKIAGIEELLDINDFPVEKVKIIALYLEF